MEITCRMPAGEDMKFGPDAFERQIGTGCPVVLEGGRRVQGTILSAKVTDDGDFADVTLQIPDDALDVRAGLSSFSLAGHAVELDSSSPEAAVKSWRDAQGGRA